MKKILGLVLVLCVVAPATFAGYLDEYTWTGTTGNFTDATWSIKTNDTAGAASRPAYPYASTSGTEYTNYARPYLGNAGAITINTDTSVDSSGNTVGFQQFQIAKGTVTVDAGGKLVIGGGYLYSGTNSVAGAAGLIVQNGGTYINTSTNSGNQAGHMMNYSTTNAAPFNTVSGAGSTFSVQQFYVGRLNYSNTTKATFNNIGTGQTISIGDLKYGNTGASSVMTWNFIQDAGGITPIQIARTAQFTTTQGGKTVVNLVLNAMPNEGDVFTLFDLAEGATSTGLLRSIYGFTIIDNGRIELFLDGQSAWFATSYHGGASGNDVTFTAIPEPATLGLLSLGGLLLARRRKA